MKGKFAVEMKKMINELICHDIAQYLLNCINTAIDYDKIAQTNALQILSEIKKIIQNDELDDFMMVDKIVKVLLENNIDSGECHDY